MREAQIDRLIDDLEATHDTPAGAPGAIRDLLDRLPATPATELHRARLTLLGVDDVVRARSAADAAVTIRGVRDLAVRHDDRELEARAERSLSRLFREIGDPAASVERAEAALALDGDDLDPVLRSHLCMAMADALAESGSFGEARDRYRQAFERSRFSGAPSMSLHVLNNWAYASLLAGDLDAASDLVDRLRELAQRHAMPLQLVYLGTIAEILHTLGRSTEAEALLAADLDTEDPRDLVDAAGCWLIRARVQRETGDFEGASTSLDTADRLTTTHELPGLQGEAMAERARLLAARGEHAGAYALHRRFHTLTLELRSKASETRAQTLRAIFEVDEARRESARYRDMSYRDPLTGLRNRRYLTEDLDRRLDRQATGASAGEPLAVAMVDLDHFKLVNDTCSHEAGDAVLVRLAALLESTVVASPQAYAARLGGEEFLLVLPGLDLARGHHVAEGLRRQIAGLDWSDLAPGVPVTASIGLAATTHPTRPPPDRADLLRDADQHLYAAKEGGRNRVEPEPAGG